MGILGNIFGSSGGSSAPGFWHNLESVQDLEQAKKDSFEQKVVIFKHSTRCFISKTVLKNFENEVSADDKNAKYYFLDLLAHRDISNKIEAEFGIAHQSPQMIVLENGKSVHDASHQAISTTNI